MVRGARWRGRVWLRAVGTLSLCFLLGGAQGGGTAMAVSEPSEQAAGCQFRLGFATVRDLVGAPIVGTCLEDEHAVDDAGDRAQSTTGGLLVWRAADNWTAFTDGAAVWQVGPQGVDQAPDESLAAQVVALGEPAAVATPSAPPAATPAVAAPATVVAHDEPGPPPAVVATPPTVVAPVVATLPVALVVPPPAPAATPRPVVHDAPPPVAVATPAPARTVTAARPVVAAGAARLGGADVSSPPRAAPAGRVHTSRIPMLTAGRAAAGGGAGATPRSLGPGPLTFHGGPVQHTTQNFTIFWQPSGTFMSPGYTSIINQFFRDVGQSYYYNLLTQYFDVSGSIANSSSLNGSWTDTRPYPSSSLSLDDLTNEVVRAINVNHWPNTSTTNYFVYTAMGEGSCVAPDDCAYAQYGGYHAFEFTTQVATHWVTFSNIPYTCPPGESEATCQQYAADLTPHGDHDADLAIWISAHELAETVTDPQISAWYDAATLEIGDKCEDTFPRSDSHGVDAILNGNPYSVPDLWSNADGSCQLFRPATLNLSILGGDQGVVSSTPFGLDCAVTCSAPFPAGSQVQLSAVPQPGNVFAGWGGACSGLGPCTVTMNGTQSVTATFRLPWTCSPRPAIGVSTVANGQGGLQVTLVATGANVWLQSLQFGSTTNALVTLPPVLAAPTVADGRLIPLGTGNQVTFTAQRRTAGPTTVPLVVTDDCGSWPTFVGGGAGAF